MGDFGMMVGSDLSTNTDLQLQFTSKFGSLKLYKWVNAQFTTDGSGNGSTTVTHGLGYVPMFQVWGKHTAQFAFLSSTSYPNAFSLIDSLNSYRPYGRGIDAYADNDKIYIRSLAIGGIGGGVSPNTTYYFRVLVWIDNSEAFSGTSTVPLTRDYGFKVGKPGVDITSGYEYQMKYSSKYRALQYFDSHIVSGSLYLPSIWATYHDQYEQEATYIDFNHSLGYPPLFMLYSNLGGSSLFEMPYGEVSAVGPTYDGLMEVSAWSDTSRVRVLFHRDSVYLSGNYGKQWGDMTISLQLILFTENLAGAEGP